MLRLCVMFLLAAPRLHAAEGEPVLMSEQEARNAFQEFPKAYWYAGDAWMKSINDTWSPGDPVTSMEQMQLVDFSLSNASTQPTATFTLTAKAENDRDLFSATFVFAHINGKWRAMKGWRKEGNRVINFYANNFMAPSMQRFVDAEVQKMTRREGIYSPHPRSALITPPAYSALIGENLSGSGFHFTFEGRRFATCSLHQFDRRTPSEFHNSELTSKVQVLKRVHDQMDLQVVTYRGQWLDGKTPLIYNHGQKPLELGEPVFILNNDQWLAAHVITVGGAGVKLIVEKPFHAAGLSGSAVISGTTGHVVAVLTGADSPTAARVAECEALDLPPFLLEDPSPDSVPDEIFGIKAKVRPSDELARLVLSNLIHPGVFRPRLVTLRRDQLQTSPEKVAETLEASDRHPIRENFPDDYLMPLVGYKPLSNPVQEVALKSLRNPTEEEIVHVTQFFLCYFGSPTQIFERDYHQSPGADLLGCYWGEEQFSAALEILNNTVGEKRISLILRSGRHEAKELVNTAGATPVSWTPDELGTRIRPWFRDLLNRNKKTQ